MREPQDIPKRAACDDQQNQAQQENQNILASFSDPIEGIRIWKHAVDAYWIGDVLDLAIAERLISANQLVLDLLVDAARDVDLAGIGNPLKPRGNVDAITVDVVCLDDDVAQIDADPIFDPVMLRQRRVASDHVLLDDDTASHGF